MLVEILWGISMYLRLCRFGCRGVEIQQTVNSGVLDENMGVGLGPLEFGRPEALRILNSIRVNALFQGA